MNQLAALAYVSSAAKLMSESELEALAVSARTENHRHQVTGVLLYDNGSFFQYLEGAPSAVVHVYERIKASRQHHGIIELDTVSLMPVTSAAGTWGFRVPPRASCSVSRSRHGRVP